MHEEGKSRRIVEGSAVVDKRELIFRELRADEHVAERLMIGISQSVEEQDDVDRTRYLEFSW